MASYDNVKLKDLLEKYGHCEGSDSANKISKVSKKSLEIWGNPEKCQHQKYLLLTWHTEMYLNSFNTYSRKDQLTDPTEWHIYLKKDDKQRVRPKFDKTSFFIQNTCLDIYQLQTCFLTFSLTNQS